MMAVSRVSRNTRRKMGTEKSCMLDCSLLDVAGTADGKLMMEMSMVENPKKKKTSEVKNQ